MSNGEEPRARETEESMCTCGILEGGGIAAAHDVPVSLLFSGVTYSAAVRVGGTVGDMVGGTVAGGTYSAVVISVFCEVSANRISP